MIFDIGKLGIEERRLAGTKQIYFIEVLSAVSLFLKFLDVI